MKKKPENPPAFPGFHIDNGTTTIWGGMSLRDYFAAAALTCSEAEIENEVEALAVAKWAFSVADAMLKVRGE